MEIDTNTALSGGGGLTGLALFWYWLRRLGREDKKAVAVDQSWEGVVVMLRAEVVRLSEEVIVLAAKMQRCESDREEALRIVAAFERRYGTRKSDKEARNAST